MNYNWVEVESYLVNTKSSISTKVEMLKMNYERCYCEACGKRIVGEEYNKLFGLCETCYIEMEIDLDDD